MMQYSFTITIDGDDLEYTELRPAHYDDEDFDHEALDEFMDNVVSIMEESYQESSFYNDLREAWAYAKTCADKPELHHPDCDFKVSSDAKHAAETFGTDEKIEVHECNLGCLGGE
jgi:hypothetical protein